MRHAVSVGGELLRAEMRGYIHGNRQLMSMLELYCTWAVMVEIIGEVCCMSLCVFVGGVTYLCIHTHNILNFFLETVEPKTC